MSNVTAPTSPVSDWMLQPAHSVDRESTVRDVLEILKRDHLSCVPVVDGDGLVVGIVTLGDLARVILSTDQVLDSDYPHYEDCFWAVDMIQRRLGTDRVSTVMSENVASVAPDQTMSQAAQLMNQKSIRHLAVTSDDHGLVGMLSANDFVRMSAAE